MVKNILILGIFFYLLTLFQTSFLAHFNIAGIAPNLILITVFLLNLLEEPQKNNGIFGAAVSGFFWDIFSEKFIGYHILILILFAFFIKLILKRYVRPVIRLGARSHGRANSNFYG